MERARGEAGEAKRHLEEREMVMEQGQAEFLAMQSGEVAAVRVELSEMKQAGTTQSTTAAHLPSALRHSSRFNV